MILQLAVLFLSLALFTALGLPVTTRLRHSMPAMALATPVFGAAILGIVSTLLYAWGVLSIFGIALLAVAASVACLILCRATVQAGIGAARQRPGATLVFLLCSLVIASPILTGGPEFSVVQGNQWDHFGYATSALVFSKLPFDTIGHATPNDILVNPLLVIARMNIYQRPSVHIVLAMVGTLLPGSITGGGYALLSSFAISGLLAFAGFLRQLFDGAGRVAPWVVALLAGACACGFWGQYALDIDAWSQVAAAPLLLAGWAMILAMLTSPSEIPAAQIAALGLLVAGCWFYYPEGTLYAALMLAVVLLVAWRTALRQARRLGMALAIGFALPLLFWQGTFRQAFSQALHGSPHVAWWRYFDEYLFGLDPQLSQTLQDQISLGVHESWFDPTQIGEPLAALMTGISGLFGVYFLTPEHYGAFSPWDGAKALLLLLALTGIVLGVWSGLKSGAAAYRLLLVGAGAGVAGALLLAGEAHLWQAGKALSYAGPLLSLALVAPALLGRRGRLWALPWCVTQGGFAVLLLLGLSDPDGIRLQRPYPESQDPTLKADGRWRIGAQLAKLEACPVVRIIAPEPFIRHYFSMALYEEGKPFFYTEPVNSYFGAGEKLGSMTALPVPRRCIMLQKGAHREERPVGPPTGVDSFPDGLRAKELTFAGVSQDGWLGAKARTKLWRPSGSNRLHLTGEIPDFSPQITAGTMTVTVDGKILQQQPETAGPFDLTLPIPPGLGQRQIELSMTGTDHLPDGRLVSLQLHSIALDGDKDPATNDDDD